MEQITLEMINEKLDKILSFQNQEVFNAEGAAQFLQISYDSLTRYARTGLIKSAKNGASYMFKREWLLDFLDKGGTI